MSQKKFRVCHITNLTQMGGVEKMLLDFLATHKNRDSEYEHLVASTSASDNVIKEFNEAGIQVFIPKRKFRFDPFAIYYLVSWLKKEQIKIVHTYNNVSNTWGMLAAFLANTEIKVTSEHGTAWDTNGFRFLLEKISLQIADLNLANSEASKAILAKKYGITEKKLQVVKNGVNFSDFDDRVNLKKSDFGITEDEVLIGTVGRVDYPKYHHLLLELALLIKRKDIRFKILLVGDGPLLNNLKQKAQEVEIEHIINFTGWRNDARDIISLFDVYLSTSYRESFGNSLVEAAYFKKPIIAPRIDGITDIFEDGKEAILIEPTIDPATQKISTKELPDFSFRDGELKSVKLLDAEIVFKNLFKLYNDEELKNRIGRASHLKVSNKFNIESYIERLEIVYNSLVR